MCGHSFRMGTHSQSAHPKNTGVSVMSSGMLFLRFWQKGHIFARPHDLINVLTEKIPDFSTSVYSFHFLNTCLHRPLHAPFTCHLPIPTPRGHPALGLSSAFSGCLGVRKVNSSPSIMLGDPKISGSAKDLIFL